MVKSDDLNVGRTGLGIKKKYLVYGPEECSLGLNSPKIQLHFESLPVSWKNYN